MTRIRCCKPAVTMLAVLALALPAAAFGQGTRPRGAAPVDGQAVPRAGVAQAEGQTPQAEAPRATDTTQSAVTPSTPPSRRRVDFGTATALPRTVPRVVTPQVVVPQVIQPRVVQPQEEIGRPGDHPTYWPNYRPDYRPDYDAYHQPNYRPRYRPEYRRHHRPYYTFLPRVRLGFGLWVGYPVTYPIYLYPYVSYPYPYAYTYPYPYPSTSPYPTSPYAMPGTAAASARAAGGLSFEIQPPEAGVYVDGQYVGMVGQFSPNQPPLALAPGRHHVEIREPGFEIVAFDVDILPGQVIPYQGDLRRF